ncbi:MAG: hypothetical protein ACREAK_07970 [Nitrosarchaeum sp.]
MKKIFFLVNNLDEIDFKEYAKKHLVNETIVINTILPKETKDYDLVILWNYRKILKNIENKKNIVIFHSSDLPYGKGWAPIYYSIIEENEFYTISGILAYEEVDSGDVIIKAKFKIKENYTADIIRKWDTEICMMLIKKILKRFDGKKIVGSKQVGISTYHERRKPEDNIINFNSKISEVINHLRACEKRNPAFFYYNKTKYLITIEPEVKPEFPKDLEITFFDTVK